MADPRTRAAHRLAGLHPAATIHGALVMGATLALMSDTTAEHVSLASAAGVMIVYWLTHAYTYALGRGIGGDTRHLGLRLGRGMRHELPVLFGGVPALVTVAILVAAGTGLPTAMSAALWVTVVIMAVFGYLAAHRAGVAGWRILAETVFAAAMGLVMVGLNTLLH